MQRTMRMRPTARAAQAGDIVVKRRGGQLYAVLPPRVSAMLKGNRFLDLTIEDGDIVVRWTDRRTRPKRIKREDR